MGGAAQLPMPDDCLLIRRSEVWQLDTEAVKV
jgi:hypothetical protein